MTTNRTEIDAQLTTLTGWEFADNAIAKEFIFKDFTAAFAFMTRAATAIDQLNHHPDWSNTYNKVHVTLSTHDAGGVTEKDFELAKRLEDLAGAPA